MDHFFQLLVFNWFQLFFVNLFFWKIAGHSQNKSKMTFLKGDVDGFNNPESLIKRSPFYCPVCRKFHMNWIPLMRSPLFLCLKGDLLIQVWLCNKKSGLIWPLNIGLTMWQKTRVDMTSWYRFDYMWQKTRVNMTS